MVLAATLLLICSGNFKINLKGLFLYQFYFFQDSKIREMMKILVHRLRGNFLKK